MTRHMARIVDPTQAPYHLAFGNLLTYVFKEFQVPVGAGRLLTKKDIIDQMTAQKCGCLTVSVAIVAPPKAAGPMSQMMLDLQATQVE